MESLVIGLEDSTKRGPNNVFMMVISVFTDLAFFSDS